MQSLCGPRPAAAGPNRAERDVWQRCPPVVNISSTDSRSSHRRIEPFHAWLHDEEFRSRLIGQRLEQKAIDHCEDGGGKCHPKRDDARNGSRVPRRTAKGPKRPSHFAGLVAQREVSGNSEDND